VCRGSAYSLGLGLCVHNGIVDCCDSDCMWLVVVNIVLEWDSICVVVVQIGWKLDCGFCGSADSFVFVLNTYNGNAESLGFGLNLFRGNVV